jgi:predicted dehydrogenase
MKILIAGLGSIGRRHLRNLLALGEQDILLYRTRHGTLNDGLTRTGGELDGFPVETDLQAALAQQPEAVVIANPTALHLDVAIPAARAGCHLLLEKPVSHSFDRIDELQTAVQTSGSRVLVGFQFRYHPGLQKIAELLSNEAIGRPLSARAHWGEYLPDWHPWEDYRQGYSARSDLGGGVILTLSHPLDYILWLFGEVSSVWAYAAHLSDLELDVEDTAEIGIEFKNGVLGSLHLDYNQRPPMHYLEIIGTLGSLFWKGDVVSLFDARANEIARTDFNLPLGFERNDLFLDEMRHFLAVAGGRASPVCSLADGIEALRLAYGARQSAHDRQLIDFRQIKTARSMAEW